MRQKVSILFLFGLIFVQSCEKEDFDVYKQDYFYYTFDFEKIPLYLLGSQVFLEFNSVHSEDDLIRFINDYSFFNDTVPIISSFGKIIRCQLDLKDTIKLKEILFDLNQDTSINYAVPVFTFSRNVSSSFSIAINEIVCDPLVSDGELNRLISPYNLTVLNSKPESPYYRYKINDIKTGFEPLNIANSLYKTNKFYYCTPNFYSSFGPLK
jgi:hypothetical protein